MNSGQYPPPNGWQPPQQPGQYPPNNQPPQQPFYQQPPTQYSQPEYYQQPPYSQYQQPNQQPPMPPLPSKPGFFTRKAGPLPMFVWILIAALILVYIGNVTSGSSASSTTTVSAQPTTPVSTPDVEATNSAALQATNAAATPFTTPVPNQPTPNAAQSDTYPDGNYKVGRTATVNSMDATVSKVRTSYGSAYDSLNSGDVLLIFDVTVKNNTGSAQIVSEGDFSLIDANSKQYTTTVTLMSNIQSIDNPSLQDGAKTEGQIVYEVPQSMKKFTLIYQPNSYLSSDKAIWDIKL